MHGRSRDFSWRNPYLKKKLSVPFGGDHSEKSALFEVHDVQDMRAAARMCYEHDICLVVRGEGSGYTAGAYNFGSGLVMDTTHMNRVLDLDASKGTITVEPGITISDLRETALSVGWDMRQFPTTSVAGHPATLGGFLQTAQYGIGSARYGSTFDFGNIIDMKVVSLTRESPIVSLDGVMDAKKMSGVLRSLGTSAIVSEVTLALAPAQYWVDVGICFPTFAGAVDFAMSTHRLPTIELRELSVFPSSILTASLNSGERKSHIHFLRNKIPTLNHTPNQRIEREKALIHPGVDEQLYEMPEHVEETEALVILSVNEASLPFLNHNVKARGGHTVYIEHNRGGYGFIEAATWQHAATRLSKYYSGVQYSHFEMDLGPVDGKTIRDVTARMDLVKLLLNTSLVQKEEYEALLESRALESASNSPLPTRTMDEDHDRWVDERQLATDDIRFRPAWFFEFITREDGSSGLIAQLNFRTQTENFVQMERRLQNTTSALAGFMRGRELESFVDPHQHHPDFIFVEPNSDHMSQRRAAKSLFDPKGLLNPRELQT